jgi:hypothetical protein
MKCSGAFLGVVVVAVGAGCSAGLTFRQVDNDETEVGIRYYEAAPYLLVHTDNDGGLVTKILYLPDQTRKMAVRGYNRGATLKVALEFKNGMLTSAKSTVDEVALPEAVIAAVEKAGGAAIAAAYARARAGQPERPVAPTPYLFKIVLQPDGRVDLVGGQPLSLDGTPLATLSVNPAGGDK